MAYPTKRQQPAHQYQWTVEIEDDLRRLTKDGYTSGMIVKWLGDNRPGPAPTRNSVIGKCARMGIKLPGLPANGVALKARTRRSVAKPSAPKPPRPVGAPRHGQASKLSDWVSSTFVDPTPVAVSPPPPKGSVALDDLRANQCRWPYGDKAPFMFCGCEAMEGKPYCRTHFTVGTIPMKAEKIRPPRDLHNVPVDFRRRQAA